MLIEPSDGADSSICGNLFVVCAIGKRWTSSESDLLLSANRVFFLLSSVILVRV